MKGLMLKQTEQTRLAMMNRVLEKQITVGEAAHVLGLSERHTWRILRAYRKEGAPAIAHGNRGLLPPNAIPKETRARIVSLAQTTYAGFNHTHLTEILIEREGITLSRSTVRNILLKAGLQSHRRRRPPRYRYRRPRMPHEGMLIQMDGSYHDWLEGRGPWLTLLLAVDDATGTVPYALFREREDTGGYFMLIEGIIRRCGIPMAVYTDRHAVFDRSKLTVHSMGKGGPKVQTQFSRSMKELGISMITARSPQAKGRVERMAGTFQDRLVSELRLASAVNMNDANRVLSDFLPRFNMRFSVPPRQAEHSYRPAGSLLELKSIVCYRYSRKVAKDNTVRYRWRTLQLLPEPIRRSYAGMRVELREYPDGELEVSCQGKVINTREAPPRPGYFNTSNPLINHESGSIPNWLEKILRHDGSSQKIISNPPFNRKPTPRQQHRWEAVREAKSRGLSERAIARLLGMSRKTVRKYRSTVSPVVYGTKLLESMTTL